MHVEHTNATFVDSASAAGNTFTVAAALSLSSLSDGVIDSGATESMFLTGEGFVEGADVTFENGSGPKPSAMVGALTDTSIAVDVTAKSGGPPSIRTWDVRVTNPDSTTVVLVGGLIINP